MAKYYSVLGKLDSSFLLVGLSESMEVVNNYIKYLRTQAPFKDLKVEEIEKTEDDFIVKEFLILDVKGFIGPVTEFKKKFDMVDSNLSSLYAAKKDMLSAKGLLEGVHSIVHKDLGPLIDKVESEISFYEEVKSNNKELYEALSSGVSVKNGEVKLANCNVFKA